MPLLELSRHTMSLARSRPSLVYCQEEYRATIAASILSRGHVGDIGIVNGGVQEWQASSMPLETPRDKQGCSTPTVLGELPDKQLLQLR
jgi:rhodanese-related sulfurtransferase